MLLLLLFCMGFFFMLGSMGCMVAALLGISAWIGGLSGIIMGIILLALCVEID